MTHPWSFQTDSCRGDTHPGSVDTEASLSTESAEPMDFPDTPNNSAESVPRALTPQELRARLQQKYEYSRTLCELAREQAVLIQAADFTGLVNLLAKKQALIDALQDVSRCSPPLEIQWKQQRDHFPSAGRQECEQWLAQAELLLDKLLTFEQECSQRVERQRDQTRLQLESISQGLNAAEAYGETPQSTHFDMQR